jgi:S1-C subfamily serine protease
LIAGIDKLSPLDVSKQELQVGATLYAVGHPGLRQLTVSSGEYIGHEEIQMLHDARTELECLQANGVMIPLPPIIQILTGQEFACLIKLDTLQTTTVIYGGNSGSPAVNMWGNVIGVVFAGNRSQEHDNYIVPLSEVKRVLNKF